MGFMTKVIVFIAIKFVSITSVFLIRKFGRKSKTKCAVNSVFNYGFSSFRK